MDRSTGAPRGHVPHEQGQAGPQQSGRNRLPFLVGIVALILVLLGVLAVIAGAIL